MLIEKINDLIIKEQEVKGLIKKIKQKTNKLSETTDSKEIIKLINEISKIRNHYLTIYWVSYIGYLKNIKDEKYLASEAIIAKYDGDYNNSIYKMYDVIDSIKNKKILIENYGKRFLNIANNQKQLLSTKENLYQKENELRKLYRKILNSPQIDFNGEKISLIKLSNYQQSENKKIRKEAYDKKYDALLSISNELYQVFTELTKIRTKIAQSCNFNNYTDYSYIKMNRIDYSKKELTDFKKSIIKHFVPLNEKLKRYQAKRLDEKKLSYYNELIQFKDGNAKTSNELTEILLKLTEILQEIKPQYANIFQDMLKKGLIDLEEYENKSSGGITTYLPDYKYPIFIKRYTNNSSNFITLTHEIGHALQLYYNKEKLLHENRWPTFDICEIHSITMELLVSNYIEKIYAKDTNKHLLTHFTNIINTIIKTSAGDDFKTEIYSTTRTDFNEIWKRIYKKYYPTNDYNLAYYKKGIMWQADINRIDEPFYGIDYALATIYALSFYRNYKHNEEKTIEQFTNFLIEGGEISFKEIAIKYNLLNPFNENDIKNLATFLDDQIEAILLKTK